MGKTKVTIYTDGACSGNPGPGGYAAIIMAEGSKKEIYGAEFNTTNNKMELMAAIKGLKALNRPCEVTLYSDSAYLVNAYNSGWIYGWKKNGWKTSSKEPVKNIELWQEIEELRKTHTVTFVKVKGHADNEYNNRCDELAVAAIQKLQNGDLNTSLDENKDKQEQTNIQKVFESLPTFETDRVKIRLFNKDDVEDLYEYCSDKQVTKWLTFDTYTDKQQAIDRIEYCMQVYKTLEQPILWAIENKQDSKMIGSIDFVKWDEESNVAEIGYALNSKYWNKGLMTEALKPVLKFGFENMGLNRIEITCDERNVASSKVAEKNGLKYEGTLRKKKLLKEEYVSIKYYSILKEEYKNS